VDWFSYRGGRSKVAGLAGRRLNARGNQAGGISAANDQVVLPPGEKLVEGPPHYGEGRV
jgi:hypothetical protein